MQSFDPATSDRGFRADLRESFRVMTGSPLLPFVSVVVWALPAFVPPAFSALVFPLGIFSIGYPATERIWFLRASRGDPFPFSETFGNTWMFIPRFLVLEVIAVPIVLAAGALGWLIGRTVGFFVGLAVSGLVVDLAFTFVTPALAFSTRQAWQAIRIGLRMIRTEWPHSAWYVLVPPLAVLIVLRLGPSLAAFRYFREAMDAVRHGRRPQPFSIPTKERLIDGGIAIVAALANLWFKGATALFYARRFDVPPFGAMKLGPRSGATPPRPDLEP